MGYVGPICGMTDGTINIGVFLDDTCTTYVPQWTYRYRNALAQGKIKSATTTTSSSGSDSSGSYTTTDLATLGTLDKYTTKQNHHHWKCHSGDGALCSSLLSYSADTVYCRQSSANNYNNNDDTDDDDDNDNDNGSNDSNEDDDHRRELEEENNNNNNYQISQEELENMETTCEAVFISFVYQGQGTLQDYLSTHNQLSHTKNYKKQHKFIVEVVVLIMVAFVLFTMSILCVQQRQRQRQRQRRRQNKLQDDDDNTQRQVFGQNSHHTRKDSASTSTPITTNEKDVNTIDENSNSNNNNNNNNNHSTDCGGSDHKTYQLVWSNATLHSINSC